LLTYFAEEERKRSIVEEHGEARYHHMIHDLSNPQKIRLTFETIVPAFLDNAVEVRLTPDPGTERVFHS
jgi:hypothetical protein